MLEEYSPVGELGVVCMQGFEEFGNKIDTYLRQRNIETGGDGHSFLIQCHCPRFGTGEGKGLINQSVRGYDLYILSDVFNYGVTYRMYGQEVPMGPDEHYQDLKRIIAATNGKARRLTVIMPMLYEGRQHRRFARESLDCAIALQELTHMGVDNIVTFDAHDPRVQNAIPLAGFENVQPTYQMIRAMVSNIDDLHFDPQHMVVVSPDEGGMSRCIYYASVLGLDLGMFYKRRDYSRIVNGRNPIISHEFLGAPIEGKDVIIVDDIIHSGDSVLSIIKDLKALGARRIFVFAAFGLFCNGLTAFDEAYQEGNLARIFTTNLIYTPNELKTRPWYCPVDMSRFISHIISTLNCDQSLSHLLDPSARIAQLLAQKGLTPGSKG